MNWLVGLGILLMAALLLWAFSALFISMLAGLAVSALLWQPLRWWRRRQLLRELEQNPALDVQQQAPCALFYLLSAAVVLLGCAAALATLIHLPDSLYSPEQLSLICGLALPSVLPPSSS
jgi:predicted PurR-regulated permease PerM